MTINMSSQLRLHYSFSLFYILNINFFQLYALSLSFLNGAVTIYVPTINPLTINTAVIP